MNFREKRGLGKTGLMAGRLGISSSYGAPAAAFEEAFDYGCNYFTWGTFIKGRSSEMRKAIKNIVHKGKRNDLIVSMFSYAHNNFLTEKFFVKGIKSLGIAYADVLLLGYYPKRPPQKIIDGALRLKESGIVRFIGISGHNRAVFPELIKEGVFDILHVRYNASNRGAEKDVFPFLDQSNLPGLISFTATKWKQLLNEKKMPDGERAPSASDCYRFVLSNPAVDICMMGAKNLEQMRGNLSVLDSGPLSEEEIARIVKVGDYVYQK